MRQLNPCESSRSILKSRLHSEPPVNALSIQPTLAVAAILALFAMFGCRPPDDRAESVPIPLSEQDALDRGEADIDPSRPADANSASKPDGADNHEARETAGRESATSDLPTEAVPLDPGPNDWPWWRGPTLNNHAAEGVDPPLRWSTEENVVWVSDVPGRGHGSPCIRGDRIFLPTAVDDDEMQLLLCYDRKTGEQLWQCELHRGEFMRMHRKNSQASATPMCDGRYVFIPMMNDEGIWLTAVDLEGNIAWQVEAGPYTSEHGYGGSPMPWKDWVLVAGDNEKTGFLAAVHRATGKIVYRITRPEEHNYGTPIAAEVAGRPQLVIPGPQKVFSYNPNNGELLWTCDGPTDRAANTPTIGRESVYVTAGYPKRKLMCIRADGNGDVTSTHVAWEFQHRREAGYVPSLLLVAQRLYMANDEGLVFCFDAKTGDELWRHDFDTAFSASPVLADGRIYLLDEQGVTFVFEESDEFNLMAKNDLQDRGYATPVPLTADGPGTPGRLYLRTEHKLWCLGERGE